MKMKPAVVPPMDEKDVQLRRALPDMEDEMRRLKLRNELQRGEHAPKFRDCSEGNVTEQSAVSYMPPDHKGGRKRG